MPVPTLSSITSEIVNIYNIAGISSNKDRTSRSCTPGIWYIEYNKSSHTHRRAALSGAVVGEYNHVSKRNVVKVGIQVIRA